MADDPKIVFPRWHGKSAAMAATSMPLVSSEKVCPTCLVDYYLHLGVAEGGNHDWPLCESGWTGDRCTFPLFHEDRHSNEG